MTILRVAVLACLATSGSVSAWAPAATPVRQRAVQSRAAVSSRRVAPQPVAVLGAGSLRRQGSALLASAPAAAAQPVLRSASLALKLVVSTLASVLCFAARAYAAERLKTAPAAAAAAPFPTGEALKWGGLAAVFGVAYLNRREEVPILTETVGAQAEEPAVPDAAAELDGVTAAGEAAAPDVMSDLRKRMQELADERAAAEQQDDAVDDSTDDWGTGNTAVLEPPKPDAPKPSSLLDDGPVVDFPVGFPLRDMDEQQPLEPSEPTASQEQIEMLERMFGTRGNA
mmetsp:Transcript_43353/g.114654  ORF Transcript_43353/g.114654 Transcript_43353/m.114654 type:complete len:285 (-) Transcript_43353:336-1190(-)